MRKNLIIYRRNPCSSLCMLIAPVIMMYLMVILREKITVTVVSTESLAQLSHPSFTVAMKDNHLDPITSTRELNDFYRYDQRSDIFGLDWDVLYDPTSPTYFYPPNCHYTNGDKWQSSPIIALVGIQNNVTKGAQTYLEALFKEQSLVRPYHYKFEMEFRNFETEAALMEYL